VNISFELPKDIEEQIRIEGADLSSEAREVYLVELYRQDRITHHQLGVALGLSRLEVDGLLKKHQVSPGVTAEEMKAQAATLREARPE
jgi:Uncharacterised protein family (UPF0175)